MYLDKLKASQDGLSIRESIGVSFIEFERALTNFVKTSCDRGRSMSGRDVQRWKPEEKRRSNLVSITEEKCNS